ncbi:MAG TPA: C1 family peptidase [Thermomicrobiales bacterium]|nr:C1 family peptidase [Thermomicrobiales bacterium]
MSILERPVATTGALDTDALARLREAFSRNPANRIAQNAVTQITVDDVALNREVVNRVDHTFSHVLDDWSVTNQKQTGRCWMFAGLNLFRVGAMKKMGVKAFEFSQAYTLFWDKLERSNYVLEAVIDSADRPLDDRTVAWLLERPLEDGGQWNMFVNLVGKHGLVPKAAMPETESSSNTRRLNNMLYYKLREGARTLRDMHAAGARSDELQAAKSGMVETIYRILCIHLGAPPATVQWQWKDDDGAFHRDDEMTPQEFAAKYVELPLDEYVCLVHDPRPTSPFGRTFTVENLGNVVGGKIVTYLNVDMDLMKRIARQTIVDGEPVWFGCDVGKMMRRDLGIWDANMFEYGAIYDTEFTLDKAERLLYHETLMTHAMLFTGVDVVDGAARRWRVENSWGEENNGQKGYFVMNDNWFAEYTFEIAARRQYLPSELQAARELDPIVLPAWDPMGALAR